MNLFAQAIAFIFDPVNLGAANGILARVATHLQYTGIAILIAVIIAVPLGLYIGHTGKGRNIVIATSASVRAIPTLGLIYFLILISDGKLWNLETVLVVLAIPPLIAGAYSGLEAVDRQTIDAARAIGMTEWQILTKVEIPLGFPLILGGLRSATLQVIATATIGAYVGFTGLGRFLVEGIATHKYPVAIAGAILVTALALIVDAILAAIQKLVVPRGVSRGMERTTSAKGRRSSRPSEATATPVTEG